MNKEKMIKYIGIVKEVLPDYKFKICLKNGHKLIAYASGKIRKNHIRILKGDKISLEISNYDINKGRITYRFLKNN